MQGRPVGELSNVAVDRAVLYELEIEVGCTFENPVGTGPPGDDRKQGHVDKVDEACGHQRPG